MKKTLRYLLIAVIWSIVSVLSVANATAQSTTHSNYHAIEMRSTSVMQPCGTQLPFAAVTGSETTYGEQAGPHKVGPNRVIDDDDDEDKPEGWVDPMDDPIGDAAIPLALLACVYMCVRAFRKKRA